MFYACCWWVHVWHYLCRSLSPGLCETSNRINQAPSIEYKFKVKWFFCFSLLQVQIAFTHSSWMWLCACMLSWSHSCRHLTISNELQAAFLPGLSPRLILRRSFFVTTWGIAQKTRYAYLFHRIRSFWSNRFSCPYSNILSFRNGLERQPPPEILSKWSR